MSKRIHNIIFNTHTVSGITISALLFVIFFAGSISFLRDEISAWERNKPIEETYFNTIDFDKSLDKLKKERDLYGRDITFSHRYFERHVNVSMTASKDSTIVDRNKAPLSNYFFIDMNTFEKFSYLENSSLGEFFYRLHFFTQLNFFGVSGYLLAGLVAFFFLFAIITGVIVHWKKIISSFYVFRPKAKWKTIWTDAHVGLGMIGLPYQFIFAVTGCYLMIGFSVMTPPVKNFIDTQTDEISKTRNFDREMENMDFSYVALNQDFSINNLVERTIKKWPDTKLSKVKIFNYGDKNMYVKVSDSPEFDEDFLTSASRTYQVNNGKLIAEKLPEESLSYTQGAYSLLRSLHYGDFGGYGLKIIYLSLGFITCFVILSGVYIWLTARNKKNVSASKRKFNDWLVTIYTAVCLSLLPITAIIFIVMKVFGESYVEQTGGLRKELIHQVFFWGWLLLSVLFTIKHDNYFTNKICLLLGGIFGLLVPVSNGVMTGDWIWISIQKGYTQLFIVDFFWIMLSLTCFFVVYKLSPRSMNYKDKIDTVKPNQKKDIPRVRS